MEKVSDDILNAVAPCSMFCSTCTGCKYGDISLHAKELLRLLDGHKEFLEKNLKKEYRHKLDEFIVFQNKLKKYANPKCGGCRNCRARLHGPGMWHCGRDKSDRSDISYKGIRRPVPSARCRISCSVRLPTSSP